MTNKASALNPLVNETALWSRTTDLEIGDRWYHNKRNLTSTIHEDRGGDPNSPPSSVHLDAHRVCARVRVFL